MKILHLYNDDVSLKMCNDDMMFILQKYTARKKYYLYNSGVVKKVASDNLQFARYNLQFISQNNKKSNPSF